MSNIAELDKKLNDAILGGKAMEAFEELYDDNVVMQENSDPEFRGKDFNRKREQEFFASVEAWHGGAVLASAAHGGGDSAFARWSRNSDSRGGRFCRAGYTALTSIARPVQSGST